MKEMPISWLEILYYLFLKCLNVGKFATQFEKKKAGLQIGIFQNIIFKQEVNDVFIFFKTKHNTSSNEINFMFPTERWVWICT